MIAAVVIIGLAIGATKTSSAAASIRIHTIDTGAAIEAFVITAIINIRFAIISAIAHLAIALIPVQ